MPTMPKAGTMAAAGTAGVGSQDVTSLMGTAREAIGNIGTAVSLREMLSGLGATGGGKTNSADSSMLGGIGQLIGGMGTAFKGMSETQTALFSSLLGKNGGGGGDQNQMMMFVLLMQIMKDSSDKSEGALARVLETINATWQQRYQDLEQRSGPSQADSMSEQLTTQLLAESIQNLRKPPDDPVDVLVNARERLQKLGVNAGGLFGQTDQFSEGFLKNRELDLQQQRIISEYNAQQAKAQGSAQLAGQILEHGPKMLESAIAGAIQTLAATGKIPGVQVGYQQAPTPQPDAPEAAAEADAALARAGAE